MPSRVYPNAGIHWSLVEARLVRASTVSIMAKIGIIDPTKVTRSALQNAAGSWKVILQSTRVNTRIAAFGPDGLSIDGSEKVSTTDLLDVRSVDDSKTAMSPPIAGVMGEPGTITIPAEIRHRLCLKAGSPVLIEDDGDKIVIQPAEIRPRSAVARKSLAELLADVTPENLHGEISTGDAVGDEAW
jgi:antitoxin MazE